MRTRSGVRAEHQRRLSARIEFAWNTHQAQENWTAKVDIKATFILTLYALILGGAALSITGDETPLAITHYREFGLWEWTALIGFALTLIGALLTILAVIPRTKPGPDPGLIYFGHLYTMEPTSVRERLSHLSETDMLNMLSHQLVAMSRVNWRKHRDLRRGMITGTLGSIAVLASLVLLRTT